MNRTVPLVRAFLFIKNNRFRKKVTLYKTAISYMVDFTIAIYLLLIVGYVIASIFIVGDAIQTYQHYFKLAGEQALMRYWMVAAILPMRYVVGSFSQPGVLFSSSEYQLGVLPFAKEKVWMYCVIEKWIKQLFLYSVVGVLVTVATPIASSVVGPYILLFMVMDILMVVPQWKLFQTGFMVKLYWIFGILIFNIIALLTSYLTISLIVFALIISINLKLVQVTFHSIHWGKVLEVSDFIIWKMPLMDKASETKFKRQRKYSAFRNSVGQAKPFIYTAKSVHHRLWSIYLRKHMKVILQSIGVLFVLLMVLLFISNLVFHVAIAIVIYVYVSIGTTLFSDLQTDILYVLPWDLRRYKQSFFKWMVCGSIPFLIPVITYLVMHISVWSPIQLVFYVCTFLFVYHTKIDKTIALLSGQTSHNTVMGLEYVFLILIAISGLYPPVSLSFIVLIGIKLYDMRLKEG